MRIQFFSDLHLEEGGASRSIPIAKDVDVIVAAGDISSPPSQAVEWLAETANGCPVVYVAGNHEWYGTRSLVHMEDERQRATELGQKLGVHFLERGSVMLNGMRFLGSTLWTDFNISGDPLIAMSVADHRMNDFRQIMIEDGVRLSPRLTRAWHAEARAWLASELQQPGAINEKTIVVTHHLPHPWSLGRFSGSAISPAFCSDLSELIIEAGPRIWIHGHTHDACDYLIGATRMLCNPFGYGNQFEQNGYSAAKAILLD